MSSLMSGYLQTWFFVASFIPWFLIDRIGRRPLVNFRNFVAKKIPSNAPIAPFNDKPHGSRHGGSSRLDLSSSIRYIHQTCCWNWRFGYALHIPWCLYRWVSGDCMGLSVGLILVQRPIISN